MGKLKDKGKLGKFHVYSGNVHTRDCGSAHCSGCAVNANGISARVQKTSVHKYIVFLTC